MRHDQRTDDNMRTHNDGRATEAGRNQPEGRHAERDMTEVPSMRTKDHDTRTGGDKRSADDTRRFADKSTPEREREEGLSNQPMARSPQQMQAHPEPTPTEADTRDTAGRDRSDQNTPTGRDATMHRDTTDTRGRDTTGRGTTDTTGRDVTGRGTTDTTGRDIAQRDASQRQAEPARAGAAAPRSGDGAAPRPGDGADKRVELFRSADVERFRGQWQEIQTRFVDDPRDAVQSADHLITEVIKSLATTVNGHKTELEGQWGKGGQTEDLRQTLRRYRSFLNRLLEV